MFYTRTLEERGPRPAGPLVRWHSHPWTPKGLCAIDRILPVGRPDEDGVCAEGELVMESAEMMHVWFLEHPLGRFAHSMWVPKGEPSRWKLNLLHPVFVHFTVALFPLAVLLDFLGRFRRL